MLDIGHSIFRVPVFIAGYVLAWFTFTTLTAAALPGVVRQTNGVYLVENHSTAGLVWHQAGLRGATVVHVDAHDDCRFVPADKLRRLAPLWTAKAWDEVFRLSDLGFVSGFKVRPEETLFDLGNFVYPCIADGTVARFVWVLPDPVLDDAARARLKGHLAAALHLEGPVFSDHEDGSFSFPLLGATVVVTTLGALEPVPTGAVLDLDIDFFAFPHALTDIHLKGDLQWDPEAVCARLESLVAAPRVTTISASVYGGYLPLMFRFLADACFDRLSTGTYPPYARQHLDAVLSMRRAAAPAPLPEPLEDPVYAPPHRHLAGMLALMAGDAPAAMAHVAEAAAASPVYAKGFLDISEACRYMNNPAAARAAVAQFEAVTGHATSESRAATAHILRMTGDLAGAEAIAADLVAWNPDPHLLLLHGGMLVELGRLGEAAACYERVLQINPQDYLALYNLANVAEQQGDDEAAIKHYRQSITLRPDFAAAEENLGCVLIRGRRFAEARSHLERATAIAPGKVTAWVTLGDVLAATNDRQAALACFRRVLELQTTGPAADHARRAIDRLSAD